MEKITYKGKLFAMVEKTEEVNGSMRTIEIARRAPGTRLIIETNDDNLLLTKEFRSELNAYDFRLPGGKVFDSLDEYLEALAKSSDLAPAIEAVARKEAHEEAGVESGDFKWIHKSVSGLTVDWTLHYFLVTNAILGAQALEADEDIAVFPVSKDEAKKMCLDGRISEERSALVLLRYLSNL